MWPARVHAGTDGSRRRPFIHRLPLALDAERATFVFVELEGATQSALWTWGGQHAGLWAALLAAGRVVEVVAVGCNTERLAAAGRVLDGWVSRAAAADGRFEAVAEEVAERMRRDDEIASIRTGHRDARWRRTGGLRRLERGRGPLRRAGEHSEAHHAGEADDHLGTAMEVSQGAGMSPAPGAGDGLHVPVPRQTVQRRHTRRMVSKHDNVKRVNRFRDSASERVFEGRLVPRLPTEIRHRARVRLQRVVAATALSDLRLPPSHRLKTLRGDRKGQYSIRINDQWRICFRWTGRGAREIEVTDYH